MMIVVFPKGRCLEATRSKQCRDVNGSVSVWVYGGTGPGTKTIYRAGLGMGPGLGRE